jgi:O-antigen/teichoic acid export membrane protein
VAGFLGLASVTIYAIANKLITYFQELMSRFFNMIGPLLSRYAGAEDSENLEEKYHMGSRVMALVSYFIAGCLILYGRDFIIVWMGPEYVESYAILVILAVGVGIAQSQKINHILLQSINRHQVLTWNESIESIVSLGLALGLAKPYGLQGIAFALTAPIVLNKLLIQPLLFARYSRIGIGRILQAQGPVLLFVLVFFGIVSWSLSTLHLVPDSYLKLFAVTSATAVLYMGFSILLLSSREREILMSIVHKTRMRLAR